MTVSELIEELKKLDQDKEIGVIDRFISYEFGDRELETDINVTKHKGRYLIDYL